MLFAKFRGPVTERQQAWELAGVALLLYVMLRLVFGPLPQWLSYHNFADTRQLGFVPRAGDVLTNLAILFSGVWGALLYRQVTVTSDDRPAYRLLVIAAILTAFGSAYYHWDPGNDRLVWDRLPMSLLLTAVLALVLADRVSPPFGREALLPFGLVAVGGVLLWAFTEAAGRGDLLLYLVMRIGATVAVLTLLILRPPRFTAAGWLWAAVAFDVAETICERLDWQIWELTGGIASGHNLKHIFSGAVIACLFGWLRQRRPTVPTTAEAAAAH